MNEAFIIGKVISKIDYRFIINKKKQFAKAEFLVKVDRQIIKVIGYNNIADYCLKYLKENDNVCIHGKIFSKYYIDIKELSII